MKSLRAWRAERLLSTRRLAQVAGTSNKTIVQIESGRQIPSFATIAKICRALEVLPRDVSEFAQALDTRGNRPDRSMARSATALPRIACTSRSEEFRALSERLLQTGLYEINTPDAEADLFDVLTAFRPSMVLVELAAGDPSGWELLARLRAEPVTSALPIIVKVGNTWLVGRPTTRHAPNDAVVPESTLDLDYRQLTAVLDSLVATPG